MLKFLYPRYIYGVPQCYGGRVYNQCIKKKILETSLTGRRNKGKKVCAVDLHLFSCHE